MPKIPRSRIHDSGRASGQGLTKCVEAKYLLRVEHVIPKAKRHNPAQEVIAMVKSIICRFPPFHATSDALQLRIDCFHLINVDYEAKNSNLKELAQGNPLREPPIRPRWISLAGKNR